MEQKTKTEEKEEKLELELVDFIPLFGAETFRKRFGKVILIIDRAPWHRAKKVKKYLFKRRREIKIIWFPRGCPEMNPVEECWRQAKIEVNGGRVNESFESMKKELINFLKHKEFKQNMRKYLRP